MSAESSAEHDGPFSAVIKRCEAAQIECAQREIESRQCVAIEWPNGHHKRHRNFDSADAKKLLSTQFERYVFLADYLAIASYSGGTIEASITVRSSASSIPRRHIGSMAFGNGQRARGPKQALAPVHIPGSLDFPHVSITIGPWSPELTLIGRPFFGADRWSLRIKNVGISKHDEAVGLLERIADALFLQVDMSRNIALRLDREPRQYVRAPFQPRDPFYEPAAFPTREFSPAAMSLYWYGRAATGMPLLQFLAFYQCIEYYFPTWYQAEAKRRIQNILRDPTFRPDREHDVMKILGVLQTGRGGVADEKSMLRETIRSCISEDEMRKYLTASESRRSAFSSKNKGLTDIRLSFDKPDVDYRDTIADRVYQIRCKIVHTKGTTGDVELLLPFSQEERQLGEDVKLLRYIAQRVLIASSTALQLPMHAGTE